MICEKCKKEISDNSNFCPYCGGHVKKEKVKTKISEKVHQLVFNIISAIIGSFGIIFCFVNVTNSSYYCYSYKGDANVINYFNETFRILNNNYTPNTFSYDGHFVSSIIGYVGIIISLLLCFIILLFSITNLITNKKNKWLNILHCVNFSIVILLIGLFQINGAFTAILASFYFIYYIVKLVFKLIDSEDKTSIKVVYGIGIGFFGIALIEIMTSGIYCVDNFITLYANNYAFENKFFASMDIVSFVLFLIVIILLILSYIFLLRNKIFTSSILVVVLTLLMILASIFSNLASTNGEFVSGFIASTVTCLIASTFIFSVGIIKKGK